MAAKHATSPIPGCKKNYGYEMPRVPTRRQQRSPAPPPSNPPGEQGLGLSLEGSRFFKKAIVKARARACARAHREGNCKHLYPLVSAASALLCSSSNFPRRFPTRPKRQRAARAQRPPKRALRRSKVHLLYLLWSFDPLAGMTSLRAL